MIALIARIDEGSLPARQTAEQNFSNWECGNPDQGLPQNLIVLRSRLRKRSLDSLQLRSVSC